VLAVVHAKLIARLEPRHHFLDPVDVHQVRPVHPPEKIPIEIGLEVLDRAVVGVPLDIGCDQRDQAVIDGGVDQIAGVHDEIPVIGPHQQLGSRSHGAPWTHRFRRFLFLNGPPGPLHRLCEPPAVHRLQQVVHGLQPEGFHRILVVRRHENEMRQVHALFPQLPDDAHAVQTGHLHIQKDHVRFQLLNLFYRL
jgi:hypothetical protein